MSQKFTSTIAGASIFLSLIGVVSRGFGFLREMIFANNFGTGTEFDLYLVGAVLPVTLNTILLFIGQNYFIPGFQKINSSNEELKQNYYNRTFMLFIGCGLLIALSLFALNEMIINLYMKNASLDNRNIASLIFKIFLITTPFSAGISMLSALLQTVYEFKYPSLSNLFLNISVISALIIFTDSLGIYVIPIGYVIGTIIQFVYLVYKSKYYLKFRLIRSLKKRFELKTILGNSIIVILLIESIGQLYSIFDRYFYGSISPGGIASLNYAYIIYMLPISIFSISLATVIFPKITRAIVDDSKSETERIYNESISVNIFLFIPITFLLFYFGETLIKIAFERGKFLSDSTLMTFNSLKCYSISLVFYSIYSVFNKIFYSINLARVLLIITILGIFLKLVMNYILVGDYQQYGLATSTTISYLFFFSTSYFIISKKLNINNRSVFIKEFILCLLSALISIYIVIIISDSFLFDQLMSNIIMICVFIIVYLVNLNLIENKSFKMFKNVFKKFNNNRLLNEV